MANNTSSESLHETRVRRLLEGARITASPQTMRELEADERVWIRLCSVVNPKRVGILDHYIAYLAAE